MKMTKKKEEETVNSMTIEDFMAEMIHSVNNVPELRQYRRDIQEGKYSKNPFVKDEISRDDSDEQIKEKIKQAQMMMGVSEEEATRLSEDFDRDEFRK